MAVRIGVGAMLEELGLASLEELAREVVPGDILLSAEAAAAGLHWLSLLVALAGALTASTVAGSEPPPPPWPVSPCPARSTATTTLPPRTSLRISPSGPASADLP